LKFGDKYETYASSYEVLTEKFHELSKRLSNELDQVSRTVKSISECC